MSSTPQATTESDTAYSPHAADTNPQPDADGLRETNTGAENDKGVETDSVRESDTNSRSGAGRENDAGHETDAGHRIETDRPAAAQPSASPEHSTVDEAPAQAAAVEDSGTAARQAGTNRVSAVDSSGRAPSDGQLQPGASAGDPVAALWGADLVAGYRARWQQLQLGFVDDPHAATRDAAALVDEAVQTLVDALNKQRQSLDEWQRHDDADTEVMRAALQNYREFLDRLLGM